MSATDLFSVKRIADAVHTNHPEDAAIFAERLDLYPSGCFVLGEGSAVQGYAITHPWINEAPPSLNALLSEIPTTPTTYYIHDIALMPDARGGGAAADVIARITAHARERGFSTVSLVAVNQSTAFWQRHGFVGVGDDDARAAKLTSYGADACCMVRIIS